MGECVGEYFYSCAFVCMCVCIYVGYIVHCTVYSVHGTM